MKESFFGWEEDIHELTCSNSCGHWDEFNQCCWWSWRHKEEGDCCDYGLVVIDGEVYTPGELEELRSSASTARKEK